MSREVLTSLIQLAISLGGAGLVVQLLLLRQNRRKIAGEASTSEANAASTLSGAALTMVENAQQDAREAKVSERDAHLENDKLRAENERLWSEVNGLRWHVHHKEMREAILVNALQQARLEVPPEPEFRDPGNRPAPPSIGGPQPSTPPQIAPGASPA